MAVILDKKSTLILENAHTEIELSKKGAIIEKITDKASGKDIKASSDICFFKLINREGENIAVNSLVLNGTVITVESEKGSFDIEAKAFDSYFTFEVMSAIPEGIFRLTLANAEYDYDFENKDNTGAVGVAMTVAVNPTYYPDAKSLKTEGRVYPHLEDIGAKYALIIAPIKSHRDIIKEACLTIDKSKGIVSSTGGAWGRDSRLNFSNYGIIVETKREYIDANLEYIKSIGIDQVDIHKGGGSFRQGDFKYMRYKDAEEFRKNVTDVLNAEGLLIGLHTYSHYINYDCDTILTKPENQAQLKIMETFTLSEDIDAAASFVPTEESTECVSSDFGFCRTNTPYILIDNEIIGFKNHPNGFTVTERGCAGTKAAAHKKGSAVKHLEGHYHGFCPILGSELFYEIARNTAKTYNEGGFRMIYLDALDGIAHHCSREHEYWYYVAAFVHEVLCNCNTDPILEGATFTESMWSARGRTGAWDTPYRGYKGWNGKHAITNKAFIDRYNAPTLGWYEFYPMTDKYPGNEHTKYHHTDVVDHLGALAVIYDYSIVFDTVNKDFIERYEGERRNIALYKKYDDLRKAQYFSEEYRQKLLECPYEVRLKDKGKGKWLFEERDYQFAKLYDLEDSERNTAEFCNPFSKQLPFIRIEALLSTAKKNPMVLLPLDETKELTAQKLSCSYGGELNITQNLAKTVRVLGNGIKGGKICINLSCATNSETGYGEYIIDTDFTGWREFNLIESDNGERTDHGFENGIGLYDIYRANLNNDRITGISIQTEGDMTGIKMSSIIAYEHTYEVLKNPTVKIGDKSVMFECELMSSDFIEFDGKTAKVIDRYANEKEIWFTPTEITAPKGKFKAELSARALNRNPARAKLTFGFTGKEIK